MAERDYYEILGLSPDATEEQIRMAYRRLALRWHPDRNPDDPHAEEKFKEISEAYAVLIDPLKRREYDLFRKEAASGQKRQQFRYSQEEIFKDLFSNPQASRIFSELLREFERAGIRFDQHFFDQLFFGGRGILFGGFFVWSPFGGVRLRTFGPSSRQGAVEGRGQHKAGLLERLGQKIGRALMGSQRSLPGHEKGEQSAVGDLHYHLSIDPQQAREGAELVIAVERGKSREKLSVKIPPGTRSGTKLRLRGKGMPRDGTSGDLYLTIHLKE